MVGASNVVTTGLHRGSLHQDNRLLPSFARRRWAGNRHAGAAANDEDFSGGGDQIRPMPIGNAEGPFRVEAELWFSRFRTLGNNLKPSTPWSRGASPVLMRCRRLGRDAGPGDRDE